MHTHDPQLLRKLAATYRARAITEPDRERVFLEIAADMESDADRMEGQRPANDRRPSR